MQAAGWPDRPARSRWPGSAPTSPCMRHMRTRPGRSGPTSAWPSTGFGHWTPWAACPRCRWPGSPSHATASGPAPGKLLGDVARGRRPGDPLHSVTLLRADLVAALRAAALESGARIVTGQRLDGESDPRTADADLIVGADGIWSAAPPRPGPGAPRAGLRQALLGLWHLRQGAGRPAPGRLQLDLRQARRVHLPS